MQQKTRNRRRRQYLCLLLALCLAGAGCRGPAGWHTEDPGDGAPADRPVPPVDREIPASLETATFAAG